MAVSMSTSRSAVPVRRLLMTLALGAALVLPASGPPADAAPPTAHPPGPTGDPIVLFDGTYLRAHDVLVDSDGVTYIGWSTTIGTTYQLHSCTIPAGGSACAGGTKTVTSPGDARQLELQEFAGGGAEMLVFYNTVDSGTDPMGARLTTADVTQAGALSGPSVWASAPSFGRLLHTSVISGSLAAVVA